MKKNVKKSSGAVDTRPAISKNTKIMIIVAAVAAVAAAEAARSCNLGLNAGHDLNLDNLEYYIRNIPWTEEVSIGHAIICDALYMGLEATIAAYKKCLIK